MARAKPAVDSTPPQNQMLHGLPNGTGVTGVGGSVGARHAGSLTVIV